MNSVFIYWDRIADCRLASPPRANMRGDVRKGGVEPPKPFGYRILSPARLPVPPLSPVVAPGRRSYLTRLTSIYALTCAISVSPKRSGLQQAGGPDRHILRWVGPHATGGAYSW